MSRCISLRAWISATALSSCHISERTSFSLKPVRAFARSSMRDMRSVCISSKMMKRRVGLAQTSRIRTMFSWSISDRTEISRSAVAGKPSLTSWKTILLSATSLLVRRSSAL